jgi:hypothetical protein
LSARLGWILLALLVIAGIAVDIGKGGRQSVAAGDAPAYLSAAYHHAHHDTFTEAATPLPR